MALISAGAKCGLEADQNFAICRFVLTNPDDPAMASPLRESIATMDEERPAQRKSRPMMNELEPQLTVVLKV